MILPEGGNAASLFGIQYAAIGQHDTKPGQRLVTVLRRAAAHAGGVVGGDATDLAGVDRGRKRQAAG